MASILSGLYPSEHGATLAKSKISEKTLLISEMMQQIGYHTIGVITHNFVDDEHGFNQGFDVFDKENMKGHDTITSEDVVRTAQRYLDAQTSEQPIFLWVHFFDPHFSFVRHRQFGFADGYATHLQDTIAFDDLRITGEVNRAATLSESDIEYVRAVYDEEIAYTDAWIGKLLNHPKLKSSLVFITADHGTYFRERGRFFHGKDVYDALVHVPLVIGGTIPDRIKGSLVEPTVEVSSIPRTIEKIIGFTDFRFPGVDLLDLADRSEPDASPFVYTEGNYAWGKDERKTGIISARWKLIYNHDPETYELYDVASDTRELNDLFMERDPSLDPIRDDLIQGIGLFPPREKIKERSIRMDKETMERLRSLGYIK
jgi:arylsulfatase A-like enzyme